MKRRKTYNLRNIKAKSSQTVGGLQPSSACMLCGSSLRNDVDQDLESHLCIYHSVEEVLKGLSQEVKAGRVDHEEAVSSSFRGDSEGLANAFGVPTRYCDALPSGRDHVQEYVRLLSERMAACVSGWAQPRYLNPVMGWGLFATEDLLPGKREVGCVVALGDEWPRRAWHCLDFSACSMQVSGRCEIGYLWGPVRLINHRAGERSVELLLPYGRGGRQLFATVQLLVRKRIKKGEQIFVDYALTNNDFELRTPKVQALCRTCHHNPVGPRNTVSILSGPGARLIELVSKEADPERVSKLDFLLLEMMQEAEEHPYGSSRCSQCWVNLALQRLGLQNWEALQSCDGRRSDRKGRLRMRVNIRSRC